MRQSPERRLPTDGEDAPEREIEQFGRIRGPEGGVVRSAMDDARQRGESAGRRRWATFDYVYSQDWAHVERQTPRGSRPGVNPRPWTSLVSPADASVARWYPMEPAQGPR